MKIFAKKCKIGAIKLKVFFKIQYNSKAKLFYNPLCMSVCLSVGLSVGRSVCHTCWKISFLRKIVFYKSFSVHQNMNFLFSKIFCSSSINHFFRLSVFPKCWKWAYFQLYEKMSFTKVSQFIKIKTFCFQKVFVAPL